VPSNIQLRKIAEADFPSRFGHFRIFGFEAVAGEEYEEAVVLKMGEINGAAPLMVRIHCTPDRRRVSQLALRPSRAARAGARIDRVGGAWPADLRAPGGRHGLLNRLRAAQWVIIMLIWWKATSSSPLEVDWATRSRPRFSSFSVRRCG
jgi:hypothetical protein